MALAQGKLEELKKKILFTFLLLVVFRLAAQVPVPGANAAALESYFSSNGGGILDLINTFSGGSLKRFSVLALGIMPYITTSIIFSLLGEVIPQIQELQEDSMGHKKIQKWTRYATVLLCCVQGYGMAAYFETFKSNLGPVIPDPGMLFRLTTMITLAAGTMFLLWLGERITEYGLENGVSLIIFAGIAVELPSEIIQKLTLFRTGELSGLNLLFFFLIILVSFFVVAYIEKSFRSVPVQYAKKVVNNRMYGGTQTLPMRLDTGGVMPPILASSLLSAPATIYGFVGKDGGAFANYLDVIRDSLRPGEILFNLLFALLIIYMSYFYAPIQFKTKKVAEMLQKNNAFVPGIRPGANTIKFLDFLLNRLTFFGAFYLIVVCVTPGLLSGAPTRFGGTAMLILVSVSVRVMMNIQSFMYSDRYETAYKSRGKYNGNNKRF